MEDISRWHVQPKQRLEVRYRLIARCSWCARRVDFIVNNGLISLEVDNQEVERGVPPFSTETEDMRRRFQTFKLETTSSASASFDSAVYGQHSTFALCPLS